METQFLSTDGAVGDDTLTPYDFAMEEVGMVFTSSWRTRSARVGRTRGAGMAAPMGGPRASPAARGTRLRMEPTPVLAKASTA